MSRAGKAAVITTVDQDDPTDLRSLRRVIECSGSMLGQFIVVVDALPDRDLAEFLDPLTRADSRVKLIWNSRKLGKVESYNRGLAERSDDAVILRSDTLVTPGWLEELADVAHSESRTACATPLTNDGGICSVPELHGRTPASQIEPDTVITGCSGLPRWTVIPKPNTTCIYLRGDILDAVGLLDPTFHSVSISLDDWVLRAETLGFIAKRANHAFVQRLGMVARSLEQTGSLHQDWGLIDERYPHIKGQHARFCSTLDASLAAHATRLESTGKLKVALDIRHLPNEKVGTRTYAVCLAKALAELGEIELSLLVRDPSQASGLSGHVVTEDSWRDDSAVIHRPAQILHPQEMKLLFESSAHVVITYLDLIGYRIPLAYPNDREFNQYQAMSNLSLQGVQRVIAMSESVSREVTDEFGIPQSEIDVVHLGVEVESFAERKPKDSSVLRKMKIPHRFFFSVATDFPHKNLATLVDAYKLFRSHWQDGNPPALVLAGHVCSARAGYYRKLTSQPLPDGVYYLGPISSEKLRVLYQHAEAMVYPSLYEGFGLPPLEAMAGGAPVVAMHISSVPEVCGDCALYPDGHSPMALARAMEQMASDEDLRRDFRARGRARVELFRWEKTARQTYDSYRQAVLHPSARSLDMRRRLLPAILSWPDAMQRLQDRQHHAAHHPIATLETPGIKQSWRSLNSAVQRRIGQEIKRLTSMGRAPRHDLRSPETLPIHQVKGSHQEHARGSEEPVRPSLDAVPTALHHSSHRNGNGVVHLDFRGAHRPGRTRKRD
jgi:glycosyltransferase involved in cell wall biosynthesis